MRLVAGGAAVVAMVFTLVAVIVVLARDGAQPAPSVKQEALSDRVVRAADVVRLRSDLDVVVTAGTARGLRVKDASLAQSLGLDADDVITAISGKPTVSERDAYDAVLKLSLMSVTTLYVDVLRKDKPVVLRWRLDGDLRQARYDSTRGGSLGSLGALGGSAYSPPAYTPPSSDPDPVLDPLLDTIEKVDDTHYKVPRKTVDAALANPMAIMKGARVVPAMRNGVADGFKLYAIRPSSPFAKVGFANGDTVHSINGYELDTPDKALEVYTKLRDATSLTFDLTRRGKPVLLTIEITK
jgi:S1-C subfamily serine protease